MEAIRSGFFSYRVHKEMSADAADADVVDVDVADAAA